MLEQAGWESTVRFLEVSGVVVGRRSPSSMAARGAVAEGTAPSYPHVGSTAHVAPPSGYRGLEVHRVVDATLAGARRALDRWATHDGIGARVLPPDPPAQGATVLVVASLGPFEVLAPNRVVEVVDEPERYGFAYATLEGHPEEGEERFEVSVLAASLVRLTVRAHSRPADRLGRALAPLVRGLQRAAADRYLRAWIAAIDEDRVGDAGDAGDAWGGGRGVGHG